MTDPLDLGGIAHMVNRPGATPAPWPAVADPDLPPVRPLGPIPGTGDRPGPNLDDPTGLRFDRSDFEETTTAIAGDGWAINGRAATTEAFAQCAERAELPPIKPMPPFNLRELARRHITAAEQARQEMRGAA